MTRIPRIKFPLRRPQSSSSGTVSQTKAPSETVSSHKIPSSKAPNSSGGGGSASEQPKRTPLSDKEIEAVLLGGGA